MCLSSASCREIVSNVDRHGYGNMFIGLNDIKSEGTFVWEDGSSIHSGYSHWHKKEPNNDHDEDCVEIRSDNEWNDESCYEQQRLVLCERLG